MKAAIPGHSTATMEMKIQNDTASSHESEREVDAPSESPIFPNELIFEILTRVPVKPLLRFRCVCKSWNFLIAHPTFAKTHLQRSNTDPNLSHHRVVPGRNIDYHCLSVSLHSLFHHHPSSPVDPTIPLKYKYSIVGACHGLLCLVAHGAERVKLCNPSTLSCSKKSPPCGGYHDGDRTYLHFGFGYDHVTDKYKVVSVYCDLDAYAVLDKTHVRVYAFGDKSWRKIQGFPCLPIFGNDNGKFVGSALNWVATRAADIDFRAKVVSFDELVVVSLDLGKEVCRVLLLPDLGGEKLGFVKPMVEVLKDCLCFYYDDCSKSCFEMWMMKEYGVEESWTKLVTISYLDHGLPGRFEFMMPLFVAENGEILLLNKYDELVLYNPEDNVMKCCQLKRDMYWLDPRIYVESLVSPFR